MLFHQLDITDPVSVEAFAKWAAQDLGEIHVLVNNAGAPGCVGCACKAGVDISAAMLLHVRAYNDSMLLQLAMHLRPSRVVMLHVHVQGR